MFVSEFLSNLDTNINTFYIFVPVTSLFLSPEDFRDAFRNIVSEKVAIFSPKLRSRLFYCEFFVEQSFVKICAHRVVDGGQDHSVGVGDLNAQASDTDVKRID